MNDQAQEALDPCGREYYRTQLDKLREENLQLRQESHEQVLQIFNRNTAILILTYALTTIITKLVF